MLRRSAKARVVAKDEGKEAARQGRPQDLQINAEGYIISAKVEMQQVRCHFCGENNIEGTLSVSPASNG